MLELKFYDLKINIHNLLHELKFDFIYFIYLDIRHFIITYI